MAPSRRQAELYKYFVAIATFGMQAEADEMLRRYRSDILLISEHLKKVAPTPLNRLYRGLLVQPGTLVAAPLSGRYLSNQYVSFSESKDVACWFADPQAFVGQLRPNDEGWICEYTPSVDQIIFHHRWLAAIDALPGDTLLDLFLRTPLNMPSSEAAVQLNFNLNNQQEVIVKPDITMKVSPVRPGDCLPTKQLDRQLRPRPSFLFAPSGIPGVSPGTTLRITDAEWPNPREICPLCRQNGIHTILYLDQRDLAVLICGNCLQYGWVTRQPPP